MDGFFKDLRFTIRNMGRSPGLAVVIALSLALGIGANTAIFSLIRTVLLRGLPVEDPDRLVLLHWHAEAWPGGLNQSGSGGPGAAGSRASSRSQAYPFFQEIRKQSDVFASVFAFAPLGSDRHNITVAADNSAERVDGEMVSGDYFRGLGVTAAAGRLIAASDEQMDAQVAVLSFAYWTRRFGADPSIVGRSININSLPFIV